MAKRSDDYDTKCGCVLVDKDNTVLSTGFNGFIRDAEPTSLPNTRIGDNQEESYKYSFMIHAEHNALLNCARQGKSTLGATSYQTGFPCNWCLQYLSQCGITKIVWTDWSKPKMMETIRYELIKNVVMQNIDIEFYFMSKEELL